MSNSLSMGLVLWVAVAVAAFAQPVPASFNRPQRFAAGNGPTVAVIADFNHDGKPDIAVATSGGVVILLNNGNGFAAPFTYSAGGTAKSIALADFNQDGNMDIAVVTGSYFVGILLGNGDGTFQPTQQVAVPSAALSVATGDFNGDGIPDLALAAGQVLVLLGNGRSGFGAPIASTTKPPAAVLVAGDFNNDGKLDLAVDVQYSAGYDNYGLVTMLGNGDGTFRPPQTVLPSRSSSGVLLVADVTGDGILDIVFPGEYLVGKGDGTFPTGVQFPTGGSPVYPAFADLNDDGYTDFLTANKIGTVSVTLGGAGGGFQPAYSYVASDSLRWIGIADFLGHGNQDIAVIAGSAIELIPGNRKGKYQAQPLIEFQQSALNNPVLADFNGDGNLDAAVLSYDYGISILLGNGKAGFTAVASAPAGPYPSAMVTGDFNGDGVQDLAVADGQDTSVHILLGNGDGTFSSGAIFSAPAVCGQFAVDCYVIAAADLDGDGKLDLVVLGGDINGTATAKAEAFLGNGDGTFGAPLPIASGLEVRQFAVGDFNRDGFPDVVLSNEANGPLLFLGIGDGTFQAPTPLYNEGPSQIVAADFNGDGNLDLAFTNAQDQTIVLLGKGNGTFTQGQIFPSTGVPIVGDLNGDGYPDMLGLDNQKAFTIYLNNGDGTFSQQKGAPYSCVSINWCGAAIGDLTGDGKLDILSVQIGNNYVPTPVTVLINTTRP